MSAFSETTNNTGLLQLCEMKIFGNAGFGKITGTTSLKQIFANYINDGYNHYTSLVISMDGVWQLDDSNYTDYAVATTNIVSGQSDYAFSASFVQILSIEFLDNSGHWHVFDESDEAAYSRANKSLTEDYSTAGQIVSYNRNANSVILLPTPNYNATAGIKIRYQRPPSYFVWGDTTKTPGFAELHHGYLVDYACMKYTADRGMPATANFANEVAKWEQVTIPKLYRGRIKNVNTRMTPGYQDNS